MQLFANNAVSKFTVGITNIALSLQVKAGEGAKFPNPTGGDFFLVTLSKISGGIETAIEIVKVTARTGDVFTIVRAQEGTSANVYAEDDHIQLRMTAGTAATVETHVNNVANPHSVTKAQVGLGNVDNTSDVNKPVSTAQAADATTKANAAQAAAIVASAPVAHVGAGGTAHADVVAGGASGFMTGADKTKLNGIATGATANVGTVTTASVATANGFAGSVANPSTTPAITITTSVTGLVKGNGTALSAAVAGTDYVAPGGALGTPSSGTLTNCTADGTNAVGFRHIPQVSQSAAYTLVLTDAGKHILHPSADTTARTFTIPANSSVAFPIGTAVTFVNQNAGGVITIAITTDTLRLAGAGTTGSRTLAANGVATAVKLTATEWIISGTGLS